MSLLFYKRPDYIPRPRGAIDPAEYERNLEKSRRSIPPELSFEMVVSNRALPPCSLADFMSYLSYVSYDTENLQFYLWFQSYTKRFFEAPKGDQALSPPWNEAAFPGPFSQSVPDPAPPIVDKPTEQTVPQTDFGINFDSKDVPLLHALQHTTHPSAFSIPFTTTAQTLQNHSHPNFIHWSTANGNRPRILFGRILGALNILFGFLIAILLLLSFESRWWRVWALPAWLLGFAFLLAGSNGICLVLYVTHDRHLRPWEQFVDQDSESNLNGSSLKTSHSFDNRFDSDRITLTGSDTFSLSQETSHSGTATRVGTKKSKAHTRARLALETFGTANSHGHEVWVEKYQAKMMIRKIFDSTIWVQNESLRIVQDRVALQAVAWSVLHCSHLRHVRRPVFVLHVAERHLRAFMFVELQFREINIWNVVEGDWAVSAASSLCPHSRSNLDPGSPFLSLGQQYPWSSGLGLDVGPGSLSYATRTFCLAIVRQSEGFDGKKDGVPRGGSSPSIPPNKKTSKLSASPDASSTGQHEQYTYSIPGLRQHGSRYDADDKAKRARMYVSWYYLLF
ncbi:uncharacterized protein KY384_006896 [Bacidia gigantensis]|uniref:uncharacterized protein n=1 Tax=Bacidia gigantensis TaxID=2732470 RepID=UPI001D0478BD|nr:uncharacterized protein KY384_006896 [Bacidia gigantensis]KAG8527980.1 hypothetical protein KY384_006896 [Bacidia gigantensis]